MEEVTGSIPVRSTNYFNNLDRRTVASGPPVSWFVRHGLCPDLSSCRYWPGLHPRTLPCGGESHVTSRR